MENLSAGDHVVAFFPHSDVLQMLGRWGVASFSLFCHCLLRRCLPRVREDFIPLSSAMVNVGGNTLICAEETRLFPVGLRQLSGTLLVNPSGLVQTHGSYEDVRWVASCIVIHRALTTHYGRTHPLRAIQSRKSSSFPFYQDMC